MTAILTILVPLFGLTLLGFGVGRLNLIPEGGRAGLDFFVHYLAMPALFFAIVAATPMNAFAGWGFVAATTFATYCAFAVAFSVGALLNGGQVTEATIEGLIGSYGNIAILGAALTLGAFGAAAALPTALIFAFDNAMLLIVTPLMMALGGTTRTNPRLIAGDIGWRIVLHPIVVATALGVAASALGIRLPPGLDTLIGGLQAAAIPAALFAFGLGLAERTLGHVSLALPLLVAVKLVVHPAIVWLLLSWIGGYDPVWVNTAILVAALPQAGGIAALAKRYGVYADRSETAILLGAALAVATVTLTLIVVLNGLLPADPFR